jgi:hypothetical protein
LFIIVNVAIDLHVSIICQEIEVFLLERD